jgi:hypothetical protein
MQLSPPAAEPETPAVVAAPAATAAAAGDETGNDNLAGAAATDVPRKNTRPTWLPVPVDDAMAKKQTKDRERALKAASQAAGLFQRSSGSKVCLPAGTALGASGKIVKLLIPAKTPSERGGTGGTSSATVAGTDQAHCGANAAAEQHNTSAITGNAEPQPDAEVRVQARARAYVCA